MRRHLMPLAAFLMQSDPPALALRVVILDAHGDDGADAGKGEGHDTDQRPIAQADHGRCVDAVQQLARLIGVQHRGFAGLDHMLRAANRMRRIGGDDLAGDQPVEQHADRGQVLLDRRLRHRVLQVLDIGRHMQRLDVGDAANAVPVAPAEKVANRPVVSHAGVLVADGGGEELKEPACGVVAGVGDDARHHDAVAGGDGQGPGRRYGRPAGSCRLV